jgi:hypothetical protein
LNGAATKPKEKNVSIDLDARARMTFVATADFDESEESPVSNEENLTDEQLKDYITKVLEEIKKKNKFNEHMK